MKPVIVSAIYVIAAISIGCRQQPTPPHATFDQLYPGEAAMYQEMRGQYVVAIQGGTKAENRIRSYLNDKGWGFWHCTDDVWLLDGVPNEYTAGRLCDELAADVSLTRLVIFDLRFKPDRRYSGYANEDGWEWMKKHWGSPG